ncbi:BMP family lipoprotein [Lactobacillus amylolyticus]|uniref:BMP family lipoprotein n=1 Tax=Lactobacillus amylolyticus TaxID=83683 RepID=UPI0024913638|nr:BMP family ABC transporter substrate-binding protein [Lactobacillus amylolyticus]
MKVKNIVKSGLIVALSGLLLAGCGHKQSATTTKHKDKSIALVVNGSGVDDKSFNQSAWEGTKAVAKKYGLTRGKGGYDYFSSQSDGDYLPNMNQAATAGYKNIFGVGFQFNQAIEESAKAHPKSNYVIVDNVVKGYKNVASVNFRSNEAAYLAGVIAAKTTKTHKVGFVGAMKSDIIDLFQAGFNQGVKDEAKVLGKKITVQNTYVGSFTAPDKAKSIAQAMYAGGVDVISTAAGDSGNGVFIAAKSINQTKPASQKVWVMGVDSDQQSQGAYKDSEGKKSNFCLTSIMTGVDSAVKNIVERKSFPGGKTLSYGLKEHGVYLTRGFISTKNWNYSQKVAKKIEKGKIKVAIHPTK